MTKKVTDKVLRDLILEVLTEASSATFTVDGRYLMIAGLTPEQEQDADQVKSLAISAGIPENVLGNFTSGAEDGEDSVIMLAANHGLEDGKVYTSNKTGAGEEEETGAGEEEETGAGEEEETGAGEEEETGDGGASKFYPFDVGEKGDGKSSKIKKAWTTGTGDPAPKSISTLRNWATFDNDGETIDQTDITHPKGRKVPALQTMNVKRAFDLIKSIAGPDGTPDLGFEKDRLNTGQQFSMALADVPQDVQKAILRNFNSILGNNAITDLAGLAETKIIKEDKSVLDWEDFSIILQNPEHPLFKPALRTLKQLKNLRDNSDFTKGLSGLVSDLTGDIDDPNVSSAETFSSLPSVDVADLHGGDRKSVPSYVVDVFNALDLGSIPTLVGRIEKISEISGKILGATDASGALKARTGRTGFNTKDASLGELMATLGVMDSLQKIAKKMDDKASGWAFESFLAQLVNGTTEGTAMGAGDFLFGIGKDDPIPTGIGGSAKFVQGYEVSQAFSTTIYSKREPKGYGPLGKTGGTLTYIVGVKKIQEAGKAQFRSKEVGRDEFSKMNAVDIHMLYLKQTGAPSKSSMGKIEAPGVKTSLVGTDIKYKFDDSTKVATLYIADDEATFQDLGKQALNKFNTTIPDLIKNINIFSKRTSSYLTAGNVDDIENALDSYVSLYQLINNNFGVGSEYAKETGIGTELTGGASLKRDKTKAVTEQKITANFLKKLIAESFKK